MLTKNGRRVTRILRILGERGRITIPYEIRKKVGFSYNDILSFTYEGDGDYVIIKKEKICDNCKDRVLPEDDEAALSEFLNQLSPKQQRDALVQLSAMWASKQNSDY